MSAASHEGGDTPRRDADEQAALRRVATLVAQGAPAEEVFDRVAREVAHILGISTVSIDRYEPDRTSTVVASVDDPAFPLGSRWPIDEGSLSERVLTTARAALIDDYTDLPGAIASAVRASSIHTTAGVPVVVGRRVWGVICTAASGDEQLPPDIESRLAAFTQLVATAVTGVAARESLRQVAREQAALRRVATLVAERVSADRLCDVVAEAISDVLDVSSVTIVRDGSGSDAVVASLNAREPAAGPANAAADVPIVVDGARWGLISAVANAREAVPGEIESVLGSFAELIATSISNARAREIASSLVQEQASLRRVATLVAEGAPADELFDVVAREVGRILDVPSVTLDRYEPGGTSTVLAAIDDPAFPVGSRWPVEPGTLSERVRSTGRAARIESYSTLVGTVADAVRSSSPSLSTVGAPVIVDGKVWGVICIGVPSGRPLLPHTESRLSAFTELVEASISNREARDGVRGLVAEQAALRHVATLVAAGAPAPDVFDAVCEEAGRLLDAATVNLSRNRDGFGEVVAAWSAGRTVPVDSIRSTVSAPVLVDGELWGALAVGTDSSEPLPVDTEHRLARFTELIVTAISNASARSELRASRARIVAAGDEARKRIERNLHDGIQQRLIAVGFDIQALRAKIPDDLTATREAIDAVVAELDETLEAIRELSRGLHPSLLSRGGLRASLRSLARRSPLPVELTVDVDPRPPEPIEVGTYFAVSEALANVVRHAQASAVTVTVTRRAENLRAVVVDDGVGGAAPREGCTGLLGIADRVETLGGRLSLVSPPGAGTSLTIDLPIVAETMTGGPATRGGAP